MKSTLIIFLVLFTSTISFGQDDDAWRDSLILARKAYEKKDYAKALKHYESAQKIAPNDIDLSDEMAQSAYRSRDFERAEKIYRQGSGAKKSKSERADVMHNLGNAQMRQENYEAAVESYKEALRNNPNDEETRYNLSEAVRKIKEKRTPPPPPKPKNPNDPQNGDPKDGDPGNKGENGEQKEGEGQEGQDSQKNSQGNNSNGEENQNNSGESGGSSDSSEGKLTNQMVERTLDKLAKKEAETKRLLTGAGSGGRSAKSGKDW